MEREHIQSLEPFFGSWYVRDYIKDFLGEGSYGQVYRIQKQDMSGTYEAAMKIITVPRGNDEVASVISSGVSEYDASEYFKGIVDKFVREFKIMASLKGISNIVSYEDHSVIPHNDGIGYDILIRMELLSPINKYFKEHPPAEHEIIKLGIHICRALELCHSKQIIHRDVKPENIFISPNGDYKLGDFGIAVVIRSGNMLSKKYSPDYAAPEIQLSEKYDDRVDQYSLGIVLYKLMNHGRLPFMPPYPEKFTNDDDEEALAKRLAGKPMTPPCNASEEFASIILKACAFNPDDRFESASDMRKALENIGKSAPDPYRELNRRFRTALGGYTVVDRIGKTAMADVYKISNGMSVRALKVFRVPEDERELEILRSSGLEDTEIRSFCENEADSLAAGLEKMARYKDHPNLVSLSEPRIVPHPDGLGRDILVMTELLPSAEAYFREHAPTEKEIIRLGADIASLLESCHANGDFHRQITPDDVFVAPDGSFKLDNFGLGESMEKTIGHRTGNNPAYYMAPEAYQRKQVSSASDQYALGMVMYHFLNNGRIPFLPPSPQKISVDDFDKALYLRINRSPLKPPANAGAPLAGIILKACDFDANNRFATITKMKEALTALIRPEPREETKPKGPEKKPPEKKTPKKWLLIAAGVLALILLTVLLFGGKKPATQPVSSFGSTQPGEEWREDGYEDVYPFCRIERRFVNGEDTGETRVTDERRYSLDEACMYFDPETNTRILYMYGEPTDTTERVEGMSDDEWVIRGVDDSYRQYARHYVNGERTDETRYTGLQFEPSYYIEYDYATHTYTKWLYLNSKPASYEIVESLGDDAWVLEGHEMPSVGSDALILTGHKIPTCREYARHYVNGTATDETRYTGVKFAAFVNYDYYNKTYTRVLYYDGKPVSSEPIPGLDDDAWILEGCEEMSLREYARHCVNKKNTDETCYTGYIYESCEYVTVDEETGRYYRVTYLNGDPLFASEKDYIDRLGTDEEEWVICGYEPDTYQEYAIKYVNGVRENVKKYTGRIIQVEEWKTEGYYSYAPYYLYERQYINGKATGMTRIAEPYKTDPSKASKPASQTTSSTTPSVTTPSTDTPPDIAPHTPAEQTPAVEEKPAKPYYYNDDGTINFSVLTLENWLDENDFYRLYKRYYDNEGNLVVEYKTETYYPPRSNSR